MNLDDLLTFSEMTEDADQPDEDFGPIFDLPFPDEIMDHTFKGQLL